MQKKITTIKIMSKENMQCPIEIKLDNNNNIKSSEAIFFKPVKNVKEYLASDSLKNKVKQTGLNLKQKGYAMLNQETIKPLKRSFLTVLSNISEGNNKIKESDMFNSVKWIKIEGFDVAIVTKVIETGAIITNSKSYKNFYIWYTSDNKTCKAKEVGACIIQGEHW